MANYEYLTIPFAGSTKETDKNPAQTLATQLQQLIGSYSQQDWEFYRVDQLSIVIKNGCLASLSGNPFSSRSYNVVAFRRRVGG